jgi:hypothetical protein
MHDREDPMTNTPKTHTDLPLLSGGNNGNTAAAPHPHAVDDIARLFREVIEPLPDPPFEVLDDRAVLDWVKRATARLMFRRDRQRLLRQAMRVLEHDWRTAMASAALREQLHRQQIRLRARQEGTYWRERDHHRAETQPTHVRVDRAAWERAKAKAIASRSTVGDVVGALVADEVRRPRRRDQPPWTGAGDSRIFARIAVAKELWAEFRTLAFGNALNVERFPA